MATIDISEHAFDPWEKIQTYEKQIENLEAYGANAIFVGKMRDFNQEKHILQMDLECYPAMVEHQLQQAFNTIAQQWDVTDGIIVHRIGKIQPTDTIVLIAMWSAHRDEAFQACRHMTEWLKSKAPFWKKETDIKETTHWVSPS